MTGNNHMKQFHKDTYSNDRAYKIYERPAKGLKIYFLPDCIIKHWACEAEYPDISREDQNRRLINEISAYQLFNKLRCPFVPKILNYSVEGRWFCTEAVKGIDLFTLSQSYRFSFSIKSIVTQIDNMEKWMNLHSFPKLKNKMQDLILSHSGKLYLVDFESYSPSMRRTQNIDFYYDILRDILKRIIIRDGKKARLTPCFVFLSLNLLFRRPIKSLGLAVRVIIYQVIYLMRGLLSRTPYVEKNFYDF